MHTLRVCITKKPAVKFKGAWRLAAGCTINVRPDGIALLIEVRISHLGKIFAI